MGTAQVPCDPFHPLGHVHTAGGAGSSGDGGDSGDAGDAGDGGDAVMEVMQVMQVMEVMEVGKYPGGSLAASSRGFSCSDGGVSVSGSEMRCLCVVVGKEGRGHWRSRE